MNPVYLIPLGLIIVFVIIDQVARRRSVSKAARMFERGDYESLLAYLETTYVRMFYPRYNRMYMQFKTLDANNEIDAAAKVLDMLYVSKPSDEQRADLLVVAFEFYLRNLMRDKAEVTLRRIQNTPSLAPVATELETLFDIMENKSASHIDEMRSQLKDADAPTRRRLLTLIAKQYENAGNPAEAAHYRSLLKNGDGR